MIYAFAILGALTALAILIAILALLVSWLSPEEPVVVREREPLMVPLVPAVARKQRPDIWVN